MDFTNFMLPVGLLALVVGIVLIVTYIFNRLQRYRNATDANLSQIQVAMKKRLDLIDQLLEAVKGYTRYEREVITTITSMRSRVMGAGTADLLEIDRTSRSFAGALLAIAEAYPDLKAQTVVQRLMEALVTVEDEVARHRYTYNNIVQELNTMVDTLPSSVVARLSGMEKVSYLAFDDAVAAAPSIEGIGSDG
jgi:LemA protein